MPDVAIVSGALGDIGRAVALELAGRGADVAAADLKPSSDATDLLDAVQALGRRVRYDQVDVTDSEQVDRWVEATVTGLGVPTWVVLNAGTVTEGTVTALDDATWRRQLDVNLTGAFNLARAATGRMRAASLAGRVVAVGSWAAHVPHPEIAAYCVAKAGLRMLCRCLALELAPAGILVNEVAAGFVDAGLSKRIFDETPGAREAAISRVPTHDLLSAHDVARAVGLLCGPDTSGMTGTALLLDGGLSLLGSGIPGD